MRMNPRAPAPAGVLWNQEEVADSCLRRRLIRPLQDASGRRTLPKWCTALEGHCGQYALTEGWCPRCPENVQVKDMVLDITKLASDLRETPRIEMGNETYLPSLKGDDQYRMVMTITEVIVPTPGEKIFSHKLIGDAVLIDGCAGFNRPEYDNLGKELPVIPRLVTDKVTHVSLLTCKSLHTDEVQSKLSPRHGQAGGKFVVMFGEDWPDKIVGKTLELDVRGQFNIFVTDITPAKRKRSRKAK